MAEVVYKAKRNTLDHRLNRCPNRQVTIHTQHVTALLKNSQYVH
jgi:hypothetical protein